ncbi:hypothetical protein ZIOFF_021643 [Zingiber officinale]|uniref:Uncharacterized protein n=2 Tax=Zingiber officinale TaxID=94328 RepID=A0A8J5LM77_ZINOF|nr:hypothetical protein ZIOFF_021643 [Zingiber officinale]
MYFLQFPLLSKSSLLERLIKNSDEEDIVTRLADVPGGAQAFELVAKLNIKFLLMEQSEELTHTFVDQTDSENSCLGYMVSGSKANIALIHQSAAINSSRVVHAQEFDVSVTMLNIAIILYHIHEYAQSLSVLKKLFQNIKPIEEQIALRVCLFLLDVALACEDIL